MTNDEKNKLYESILSEVFEIIDQHLNEAAVEIKFPKFDKMEFIKEFGLWVKSFKMKTLPDEPIKPQMRQKPEVIDKPRKPTESFVKEPELPSVLKTISNKEAFLKHMSELYGDYFGRFLDYYQRSETLGLGSTWWLKLNKIDDPQKIYSICNDAYQTIQKNIDNVTSAKEREKILETLGKYVYILRLIVENPEKAHSILSKKAIHRDEKIIDKYNERMREYQERIKKYGKPYSDDYLKKKEEYETAIEEYNKKVEAAAEYADTSGFATEGAYERAMEKYELALDKWEDAKMKFGPDRKISITDYLLIRYIYAETGEEVINTKYGRYKVPKWLRGLRTSQMVFQDKSFEHRNSYAKFLEMNPKISYMTSNGLRANPRTGWTLKKFVTSWVINFYMGE
jgi:hypothetical protein